MLSKRKFENIVSYGDFTFYGNKKFSDQLIVQENVNLCASNVPQSYIDSNSGWINNLFSNIPQSSIISTAGWIRNSITQMENTIVDTTYNIFNLFLTKENAENTYATKTDVENTYATKTDVENTYASITDLDTYALKQDPTLFGTVTFNGEGSTISDYLKKSNAASTYATKLNPFFSGLVTFGDGSMIQDYLLEIDAYNYYLKKTDAASTYAPTASPTFTGTVTFPDSSTITNYLKTSDASSTYLTQTNASSTYLTQSNATSTYAPKVSPTFTGNIVLNGNVTLAETSANSLTLNDNLLLCAGTHYATPNASNMLGYGATGTIVADTLVSSPNIQNTTTLSYGSVMAFG